MGIRTSYFVQPHPELRQARRPRSDRHGRDQLLQQILRKPCLQFEALTQTSTDQVFGDR